MLASETLHFNTSISYRNSNMSKTKLIIFVLNPTSLKSTNFIPYLREWTIIHPVSRPVIQVLLLTLSSPSSPHIQSNPLNSTSLIHLVSVHFSPSPKPFPSSGTFHILDYCSTLLLFLFLVLLFFQFFTSSQDFISKIHMWHVISLLEALNSFLLPSG